MHERERVVERAGPSDGGCATPCPHVVCILGKRHALRIHYGRAVVQYEIGLCPLDRCAKAASHSGAIVGTVSRVDN
jgi:hypothetical protein